MAVTTDRVTNPGVTFTASISWSHAGGAAKGVFVTAANFTPSGVDEVVSATYGGVPLIQVASLYKTTGEAAGLKVFFKGSGLPSGAQVVTITTTGETVVKAGGCRTLLAARNVEIVHQVTWRSDSLANPLATLLTQGRETYCFLMASSGHNTVGGVTPLVNWAGPETDFGNAIFMEYVYSGVGVGNVATGWTQVAEDALGVSFAVAEVLAQQMVTIA